MRDDNRVTHFLDDCWEKNGQRGECHVGKEEHECRQVGFGILDRGEDFFDLYGFCFFLGFRGGGVITEAETSDAFLAAGEIVCGGWRVWDGMIGYYRYDN